jgi:hypothetical protein
MRRLRHLAALPLRVVGDVLYEVVLALELGNQLICGNDHIDD